MNQLSDNCIELLTAVKFNILAVPETFDMRFTFDQHECGTVARIAGHVCALIKQVESLEKAKDSSMNEARRALGLSERSSRILFHASLWTHQSYREYTAAQTYERRASVAARRIDHFITTNGEE